jgi:hypothetical protein
MNPRRVASFVDAVLSDRRPAPFKADPVDAGVLRVAIAMRAAQPGEAAPEAQFVAQLQEELAQQARPAAAPPARARVTRRARLVLAAASVVTMVGGTVAATTAVEHSLAAANVSRLSHDQLLRVGQFESAGGQAVGEIVAYRGAPSWVLMSIRDPGMNGPVGCRIEMSNGRTAATGTFVIHNGVGEFARPISVDIGQFREATLMTSAGSVLATASFPS